MMTEYPIWTPRLKEIRTGASLPAPVPMLFPTREAAARVYPRVKENDFAELRLWIPDREELKGLLLPLLNKTLLVYGASINGIASNWYPRIEMAHNKLMNELVLSEETPKLQLTTGLYIGEYTVPFINNEKE